MKINKTDINELEEKLEDLKVVQEVLKEEDKPRELMKIDFLIDKVKRAIQKFLDF